MEETLAEGGAVCCPGFSRFPGSGAFPPEPPKGGTTSGLRNEFLKGQEDIMDPMRMRMKNWMGHDSRLPGGKRKVCTTSVRLLTSAATRILVAACVLPFALCLPARLQGAEAGVTPGDDADLFEKTVQNLAQAASPSMVVITQFNRDGEENGVGAGFIVDTNGLIATCHHVMGEGRRLRVRLSDGTQVPVKAVHAWDRNLDLALLQVDLSDAPTLTALPLGDSDDLTQGAFIVALGNPLGLEYSVVHGVLSARREVEGREMFQLAIPIEPGNSGGPVIDRKGHVQGIVNMKSAMSRNLGFAIPINQLRPLLEKPNPVSMERWLAMGALDPDRWESVFGARWFRRGGRILVEDMGHGFGGRALCLQTDPPPSHPYDIRVSVKLDDEAGAAGLAFGSDRAEKHYGFYPSGGNLRLTRFDGPSVYSWTILDQVSTPHYRPGDWNTLRVRWETNRLRCYVNRHLVIESNDQGLPNGQAGMAKFRQTHAEFRNFAVGASLESENGPADLENLARLEALLKETETAPDEELVAALEPVSGSGRRLLQDRALALEREAVRLRELATRLHRQSVRDLLVSALDAEELKVDLFRAGLLIAKLDDPELDMEAYGEQLDRMAVEIREALDETATEEARLAALIRYLFEDNGFHGSRLDYNNRANSYLNQVLDNREGIPITLSVIFMELGQRIGLEGLEGVPLPGHFMVRQRSKEGRDQLVDVFDGGTFMDLENARRRVLYTAGVPLQDSHMQAASKRSIIIRMLRNLWGVASRDGHVADALAYQDCIVALAPDSAADRWERIGLRLRTGDRDGAAEDFRWLLDHPPPGVDSELLLEMYQRLVPGE